MRRFDARAPEFESAFRAFLDAPRGAPADVDTAVAEIIGAVKTEGLAAVLRYNKRFDGADLDASSLRVTAAEIEAGAAECPAKVRDALVFAADRIRAYHERQKPADLRFVDSAGVELGWRWTALDSVGIYVPGGRAAYPSSLLMNAMPAAVAGVGRVAMGKSVV